MSKVRSWHPEPGETLSGRVHKIGKRDAGYGEYPLVHVRTADGRVAFHAYKARDEVEGLRAGDYVVIECLDRNRFQVTLGDPPPLPGQIGLGE